MPIQTSATDPSFDETTIRDRDAFVAAVRSIVGQDEAEAYARIVNDLIAWSLTKTGAIELSPRDGKQDIIRFCLTGTSRVFWSAYPRLTERDAKLVAVQDEVEDVPSQIRVRIREQFIKLSRFAPEKSTDIPSLSFRLLKNPTTFAQVIEHLEEAINGIQANRT